MLPCRLRRQADCCCRPRNCPCQRVSFRAARISVVFVEGNCVGIGRPLRIHSNVSGYRSACGKSSARAICLGVPFAKRVVLPRWLRRQARSGCRLGYRPCLRVRLGTARIAVVFVESNCVGLSKPLRIYSDIFSYNRACSEFIA